jgi:hypothetical protein
MMARVLDCILRSFWINGKAGAAAAEDIAPKRLNNDNGTLAIHFSLNGQFLGFSGSSGPFHVTCRIQSYSLDKKYYHETRHVRTRLEERD